MPKKVNIHVDAHETLRFALSGKGGTVAAKQKKKMDIIDREKKLVCE